MYTAKQSTALANVSIGKATTAGTYELVYQYVGPELAAQDIAAGTFKGQIMCYESGTNDNIDRTYIKVLVVDSAGALRGTLAALSYYGSTAEFPTSSGIINKYLANGDATGAVNGVQAGDRIVIEIGFGNSTSGTSITGTMRFGDTGATDLPENESDTTTTKVPWVELSETLKWLTRSTQTATAVATTASRDALKAKAARAVTVATTATRPFKLKLTRAATAVATVASAAKVLRFSLTILADAVATAASRGVHKLKLDRLATAATAASRDALNVKLSRATTVATTATRDALKAKLTRAATALATSGSLSRKGLLARLAGAATAGAAAYKAALDRAADPVATTGSAGLKAKLSRAADTVATSGSLTRKGLVALAATVATAGSYARKAILERLADAVVTIATSAEKFIPHGGGTVYYLTIAADAVVTVADRAIKARRTHADQVATAGSLSRKALVALGTAVGTVASRSLTAKLERSATPVVTTGSLASIRRYLVTIAASAVATAAAAGYKLKLARAAVVSTAGSLSRRVFMARLVTVATSATYAAIRKFWITITADPVATLAAVKLKPRLAYAAAVSTSGSIARKVRAYITATVGTLATKRLVQVSTPKRGTRSLMQRIADRIGLNGLGHERRNAGRIAREERRVST